MSKKKYIIPKTSILHMSQDAVLASESWNDGHGNWDHVVDGNPIEEVDPYALDSEQGTKALRENWDLY